MLSESILLWLCEWWSFFFCWSESWIVSIHWWCIFTYKVNLELREVWLLGLGSKGETRSVSILWACHIHCSWISWQIVVTRSHFINIVWNHLLWSWSLSWIDSIVGACKVSVFTSWALIVLFTFHRGYWTLPSWLSSSGNQWSCIVWSLVHIILCPFLISLIFTMLGLSSIEMGTCSMSFLL